MNNFFQAADEKVAVETTKEVIEKAGKALDLYNQVLDRIVPWKTLKEKLNEMDKHQDEYALETIELFTAIKMFMASGIDAYFRSTKSIFDWTSSAIPELKTYIELFDKNGVDDAIAQKAILLKLLGDGIKSMNQAQNELDNSSANFNQIAGKLTSLKTRLDIEFHSKYDEHERNMSDLFSGSFGTVFPRRFVDKDYIPKLHEKMESIKAFYEALWQSVSAASDDILETKRKLQIEIRAIGELKVETEETKVFVDLDRVLEEFVIQSVQNLIDKCNEFRQKHSQ